MSKRIRQGSGREEASGQVLMVENRGCPESWCSKEYKLAGCFVKLTLPGSRETNPRDFLSSTKQILSKVLRLCGRSSCERRWTNSASLPIACLISPTLQPRLSYGYHSTVTTGGAYLLVGTALRETVAAHHLHRR